MGKNSEDALVAEATELLGGDEKVLAAGVFGLTGLLGAMTVGNIAGNSVAGAVEDMVGHDTAVGAVGDVVGMVAGGIAAKHAYAESKGASVQLLVAVTEDKIHVLNRDRREDLPVEYAYFDRATSKVTVTKFGLSRMLHIEDAETGNGISLTGSTGGLSSLSKGDKVVFTLLTD